LKDIRRRVLPMAHLVVGKKRKGGMGIVAEVKM
jgi:hypothetical protein